MKKKYFVRLILIFSCFLAFSHDGIMARQKNVCITKTTYFDLIYPADSRKSAALLFENADRMYEELAQKYGMKHLVRLPVVISPAQDELNAYYSSAPFSHIVIYDTPADENMILFTDQFINIFRHELVHFVTYNLHNDFWYGLEKALGDAYNPAIITATMGFAEGAAVATESDFGEGRINSDFHKQIVRQAKIEGKFPKYSEIQGSRDGYSTGNYSYYFGGAFCDYLQKKYGIEKFAEFWYRCANFKTLFYFACFKRVYGISIKAAWKDFYDSIEIPDVPSTPDAEAWCKALFTEKFEKLEKLRLKKSKNSFLDFPVPLKKGVAYYNAISSKVAFCQLKEDGSFSTPRNLFSQKNVSRLSSSADGEYIAASYTSYSGRVPKKYVRIYNTNTRRSFYMNQSALHDASVFSSGGSYYVAAVKTHSQNCFLEVYALETRKNGSAKNAALVFCEELDFGDIALSPSGAEGGDVYFIKKSGGKYSIERRNFLTGRKSFVALPENLLPASLTVCVTERDGGGAEKKEERLALSFTEHGTMPRLALLGMDFAKQNASLRLSENDSSGGIFHPVYVGGSCFAYTAKFLEEKRIFIADAAQLPFASKSLPIIEIEQGRIEQGQNAASGKTMEIDAQFLEETKSAGRAELGEFDNIAEDDELTNASTSAKHIKSTEQPLLGEKKFSAFAYQFTGPHGTLIPFSIARSFGIKNTAESLGSSIVPFGITYVTSSPWTMPIFAISGGYSPFTNSGAIYALLYGGTYVTDLFTYQISANVEFDGEGYKQTSGEISLASKIELHGHSYIRLSENFKVFEGRQSLLEARDVRDYFNPAKWLNLFNTGDETQRFFQSNKTVFAVGNTAKIGRGYYDYNGFDVSLVYDQSYSSRISKPFYNYYSYQNFSIDLQARNSNVIPLSVEVALFPSKDFFLGGLAEAVLFSYEIQKSTNFFPIIYANRISISLYYQGMFSHNYGETPVSWGIFHLPDYCNYLKNRDFSYFDMAALTASFFFTPNFGGLARSSFQMQLSGTFFVRPNPLPAQKKVGFSLGFSIL